MAASAPPAGLARLLACRNVAADAARLKCFDRTSASLARQKDAAASTASSGAHVAAAGTSAVSRPVESTSDRKAAFDPRQTFGLSSAAILAREVRSGARPKSISSITARIESLQTASDGRMIYGLDNGQIWEELLANGDAPPVRSGDRVTISRGWLDSYWMQTVSGRGCKVERLR